MSVFKIFPSKDTTIYSSQSTINAGRDEILEISAINNSDTLRTVEGLEDIRRTLIQFDNKDLQNITSLTTGSFSASLKMYLAYASALPLSYTINCYPVYQDWVMGTGKFADQPNPKNGASWYTWNDIQDWSLAGDQSYLYTTGGGTWNATYSGSQTFDYISNKDLNMDVSSIVRAWLTGSIANHGFLLKHSSSVELDASSSISTKFFSMDTHTIYPPCLEIKWDDSTYNTGSVHNSIVTQDDFILISENNIENYEEGTKYKMKFKVRDRFPTRTFTTSSDYLTWKFLPSQSYWGIQDYKTKEMIIDFDDNFTKLSADSNGNYFYLYTNGLQPERSYKVIIKTVLNNTQEVVVVDNDIIFKVNR